MSKLSQQLRELPSTRTPAYRPVYTIESEERAVLEAKIGGAANYNTQNLSRLAEADPHNIEFRKALVSGIMSAEFAGVDAFGRKVCQWQEWPVPWTLIMAMARQTWDEVRHAHLAAGVLESYGGVVGEYPDTLAGGGPPQRQAQQAPVAEAGDRPDDPIISLSTINVSLEGSALNTFHGISKLGEKLGDELMRHCYDYNWADEVTHTAIGDYFVKQLCDGKPEEEHRALRAHARAEWMRTQLNGEQVEEIRQFFDEENERATEALAADGSATGYR